MAETTVNSQVTDALTSTVTATVGESAAVAMGMLYQAEAQAFAIGMQNAATSQNNVMRIGEAIVATACSRILSLAAK